MRLIPSAAACRTSIRKVADWMRDALAGKFPAGYKKRIDQPAR